MSNVFLVAAIKNALVGLLLIGIVYAGACLFLFVRQRRMIFVPSSTLASTPSDRGLPYEDVWISVASDSKTSEPGERIHGWWVPAADPHGVILYLHGNGENISANIAYAERFHRLGFSVLMIDYRGYGLSDGRLPSEAYAYDDAIAAWNYLQYQRGVEPRQIVLYGHSLGGAIALDLAIKQPSAAGLIVEGTFTSIQDVIDRIRFYRLFPISWLLNQRFESISKMRSLQIPILIMYGMQDAVIPPDMSESLYAIAPEPKQLLMVPLAGHNNLADIAGDEYTRSLQQFMTLIGMSCLKDDVESEQVDVIVE
ncbi:MAG: alpha/beta hydrolase [Elainellaceae cyanobacterium]